MAILAVGREDDHRRMPSVKPSPDNRVYDAAITLIRCVGSPVLSIIIED